MDDVVPQLRFFPVLGILPIQARHPRDGYVLPYTANHHLHQCKARVKAVVLLLVSPAPASVLTLCNGHKRGNQALHLQGARLEGNISVILMLNQDNVQQFQFSFCY